MPASQFASRLIRIAVDEPNRQIVVSIGDETFSLRP
jgi:hypothetical protein